VKGDGPENRGGKLFLNAGAILPYQKTIQFIAYLAQETYGSKNEI
jgi:hypothetical protein